MPADTAMATFLADHVSCSFRGGAGPWRGQHLIHPFFQQRRTAEPVERELQYQPAVLFYEFAFGVRIYFAVRVCSVQVVYEELVGVLFEFFLPAFVITDLPKPGWASTTSVFILCSF